MIRKVTRVYVLEHYKVRLQLLNHYNPFYLLDITFCWTDPLQ